MPLSFTPGRGVYASRASWSTRLGDSRADDDEPISPRLPVWVGHAMCNDDLAVRAASEELVEAAFASRINTTLGRLAGPYARWLEAAGRGKEGKSVFRRAIDALHSPLGATETILCRRRAGDR